MTKEEEWILSKMIESFCKVQITKLLKEAFCNKCVPQSTTMPIER